MKGSLPPSSSTDFLISQPACAAMARPAASLPVTVTAATRSSARTDSTWRDFDEQRLEGAAGKAGAADQRLDGERALRDVRRVLEQADVAGHQRGREEAEDLPEGEVPGHDGEHDAERVPAHVAVVGSRSGWARGRGCARRFRRSSGRRRRT